MRGPRSLIALMLIAAALAVSSLTFGAGTEAPGGQPRPYRIFVVQSYNPEYIWTQNINDGVREALGGLDVTYEYAYMDAKRHPDKGWLSKAAAEVLERIRKFDPDIVIPVDDAAQAYLVVPYLKDKPRPQVVFCGVNAPPSLYGYPASNVSGVRERYHYREGFSLLKRLVPSARSVAFLVDASDAAGYLIGDLREDLATHGPYALELENVDAIPTFQRWQHAILEYQKPGAPETLALALYHSLRDETTGEVVPPEKVMEWTNSVNKKPTLGFADFSLDHSILCGVLESGHEQGFLAGSMARETLLKNVPAGGLPFRLNDRGIIMVNLKAAERLGVDIPYEIIEAAGVVIR